jgi:CheY-like chemotaxis protein
MTNAARAAAAPERRILLVDDEPGLRRTLSDRLRKEGYAVDTAANGAIALDLARKGHYDLIILDLNLPAKDGLQVCHELRREGQNVAVLMLTARDSIADKITGLKSGADDYMTKPFESAELLARMEALFRRTRAIDAVDELSFGDVVVRPRAGQVLRDGAAVGAGVQAAGAPGAAPGRGDVARRAARRRVGLPGHAGDPHRGRARQLAAPEAGTRSAQPALHRHRVRAGISV